jgi:IS30 family transposase
LLTIHFVDTSLMLAFIRDANTSRSVTDIWDMIYRALGRKNFEKLCPVILTDNGKNPPDEKWAGLVHTVNAATRLS